MIRALRAAAAALVILAAPPAAAQGIAKWTQDQNASGHILYNLPAPSSSGAAATRDWVAAGAGYLHASGLGSSITAVSTIPGTDVTLAAGQIGFGNGSNQLSGSSDLQWDSTNKTLMVNAAGTSNAVAAAQFGRNSNGPNRIRIWNSNTGNAVIAGLLINAGSSDSTLGGQIVLSVNGDNFVGTGLGLSNPKTAYLARSPTGGSDGELWIVNSSTGSGSDIILATQSTGSVEAIRILNAGQIRMSSLSGGGHVSAAVTSGQLSVSPTIPYADISGAPAAITALTSDVTATGPGSVAATIAANAVTYAKMQDVSAASRLLGRGSAAGAGDPQEITLGSGLSLSGTTLTATGSGGTVTSVTATLPLVSTGGATPNLSLNYDNATIILNVGNGLQVAASTGDVTKPAGSNVTTLANIPNDVPMAGDLLATAIAAPATPAAGKARCYVGSTSKNVECKNDAGTINHGAQTFTAAAHQFATALSDAGAWTTAQPSYSDLSGSVPAITALTGDVTATGPGSVAATLATVGGGAGSCSYCSVTFDAKGRQTAYSSGATPAPVGATFITQQPDGTLTNEQALSALASGVMQSLTTTGVVSTFAAGSTRVVFGSGINGTLADSSQLTYNGSTLTNATASTTSPAATLRTSTTSQGTPVLTVESSSSSGVMPIFFKSNGTLQGTIRSDFGGNMAFATGNGASSGNFSFLTDGDFGTGSVVEKIFKNGHVLVQTAAVTVDPSDTGKLFSVVGGDSLVSGGTLKVTGTTSANLIAAENTSASTGAYAEVAFINNLGSGSRGSLYYTSSTYTGTETHPSSFAIGTAGGSSSAVTISPNNVLVMDIGAGGATKFPAADSGGVTVALTKSGNQSIEKQGTGSLFIGTLGAQSFGLYTNNFTRLSIDSAGALTAGSLTGTGTRIVSASSTGLIGIATTSDIATALALPGGNRVLAGNSGGTGVVGDDEIRLDNAFTDSLMVSQDGAVIWRDLTGGTMIGASNYGEVASLFASHVFNLKARKGGTGTIPPILVTSTAGVTVDEYLQVNGPTAPANVSLIAGHTTNHDRDHAQLFLGGGASQDNPDNVLLDVFAAGTTVPAGRTTGSWATMRVGQWALTGASSPNITEATGLLVAAPTMSGITGSRFGLHVTGGAESRFDGSLTMLNGTFTASTSGSHILAVDDTRGGPYWVQADGGAGDGLVSTSSTTGFTWIPEVGGTPTGTPAHLADRPGATAMVYDRVNDLLYVWHRNSATWKAH